MSAPPSSAGSPSLRALFSSRAGHLALAVLVVELLAGMQIYLSQTVLPLLATEMGARNAYGLVTAAAQVPAFLTMPLGGAMLAWWRPDRLMTALTALLVVGAVVGALAPNVEVYVLGEILRGLAAGALATATMGSHGRRSARCLEATVPGGRIGHVGRGGPGRPRLRLRCQRLLGLALGPCGLPARAHRGPRRHGRSDPRPQAGRGDGSR